MARRGVTEHDEPIWIRDDRQRLTVALVQKKVSELLDDERFGTRFQVGMLASFESFLETSAAKKPAAAEDPDDITDDAVEANFDDVEQAADAVERQVSTCRCSTTWPVTTSTGSVASCHTQRWTPSSML
ncbi:hypothetical protein V2I01_38695 [Micromonospora sp. BRA006-A]|nr:hypothetical protein [Micromonospora sp. BRA006-A]